MSVLLRGFLLVMLCCAALPARAATSPALPDVVRQALKGPMAGVEDIVFAVRGLGGDSHWYANFGYHVQHPDRMQYGPPGGKLCRLNLRTGNVKVLLDDPQGGVRDPCVHYDGKKILFSYRKGGTLQYHLYEINADGTGLRQLTDGPRDEIEPIYLPDGDLVFGSSRCNRWVQCWFTQVAILYRSDPNGRNIRPISANIEQDNTPWMLPDGRLLYMRWEYVDRSRVQFHHLWTLNPDGTGQMTYYGNQRGGIVMLDAKPIPGTNKVVAVFSPGHGKKEHAGRITIVTPDAGPDAQGATRTVSHDDTWRDPYPFSEDCFLAASERSICVMDGQGNVQAVYTLPPEAGQMEVHEPRPLVPRPREPVLPPRVDPSSATGRLILADVTHGRNMAGVRPGEIRRLLVMETLPKPVNFSGTMEPISLDGTFTLPRILGTVPVEEDGSAYFEVPALRPLFFIALDENNLSVKRMQSFVSVMPGETTACSGCHENRTDTARFKPALAALSRPPSRIEPIRNVPAVFDFPRDIQPIIDRHCGGCHNYEKFCGGAVLTADRGPIYSHAYATLMSRDLIAHGRDAGGNRPPRSIGAAGSRLMTKIGGGHNDVRLTPHETDMIRLWIESGAPYPGTYAALGTGMVGVSANPDVLARRCVECHADKPARKKGETQFKTHPDLLFNLSRPEKSLVLLAPLSKGAGGLGLCEAPRKDGLKTARVFADTHNPDYRKLLAGAEAAKRELDGIKRFDMPGFQPNQHYIREMKRFGILPESLGPGEAVDPYATDLAYWQSFWYKPALQRQSGE